jgi:hypothetical protein
MDLDGAETVRQFLQKLADDTKLGQIIERSEDARELQNTLNRLCEWTLGRHGGMAINVLKCHVMHVNCISVHYESLRLATTKIERDVGVPMSSDLKQAEQCSKTAQTAGAVLGQIHRAFHYRDRQTYLNLYKQYTGILLLKCDKGKKFLMQEWPMLDISRVRSTTPHI